MDKPDDKYLAGIRDICQYVHNKYINNDPNITQEQFATNFSDALSMMMNAIGTIIGNHAVDDAHRREIALNLFQCAIKTIATQEDKTYAYKKKRVKKK